MKTGNCLYATVVVEAVTLPVKQVLLLLSVTALCTKHLTLVLKQEQGLDTVVY